MYIIGFETSCDDTCVSIIKANTKEQIILSDEKQDQMFHTIAYGGVMPTICAKNHKANLPITFEKAISKSGISIDSIDIISVTIGPGIKQALLMGNIFASTMCAKMKKTFIPVHHIEAHIIAGLPQEIEFPYLALIVSGGHSIIVACWEWGKYETIVSQLDDAAGEVFDKIARDLQLPLPGGPWIERLALKCKSENLPVFSSMSKKPFFSFSGIKTAIKKVLNKYSREEISYITQSSIIHIICEKLLIAVKKTGIKQAVCSGGVLSNLQLRNSLSTICSCFFPPVSLCTDNGFMIAKTAFFHLKNKSKLINNFDIKIFDRMKLDDWSKLF